VAERTHWTLTTLNVNGMRSAVRKGFPRWRARERMDVLCLQELRMQADQMDAAHRAPRGWHSIQTDAEKKGYSGVAVWSRLPVLQSGIGVGLDWADAEGRMAWFDVDAPGIGPTRVISLYLPSGSSGEQRQARKEAFLDHLLETTAALLESGQPTVICGDINIAHRKIDIHNPTGNKRNSGFLPNERAWMDKLLEQGWVDVFRAVHPDLQVYSWWSNRGRARELDRGWRIDYQLATPDLAERADEAWIRRSAGLSDHAPVSVRYRAY
jgi:exodeoxyribonuclease-3